MAGPRASAARVQATLIAHGLTAEVREFGKSTRTATDAAAAIGCAVAQIAKSIVFRAMDSSRPILVIASGVNRVDERRVEVLLGERLGKADADFVRRETGFVIGGVPPVGHDRPLITFIDQDLMAFEDIWAAAGTPFSVFRLAPRTLVAISDGTVAELALPRGRPVPD